MPAHKFIAAVSIARPDALYLLAIAGAVLVWSLAGAREWKKIAAPIMRAIVLALFIFALANPESVTHFAGAARPAIVDASQSITPAMRTWTARLLEEQLKLRASDPAFVFASSTDSSTIGAIDGRLASGQACSSCAPGATNLETALMRIASDPGAEGGPAVLVTDGWENRGDSTRAIGSLVAARIRLDIFTPPGASSIRNVAMTELSLPPALEKAEPFALGVTMENLNDAAVSGTIAVSRDSTVLDTRHVTLPPGLMRVDFPVRNEAAGLASYSASFKADDPTTDQYLEDDSLKGWVGVGARRKVLILAGVARDAKYLQTVAERRGFEPTIVPVASGQWNGKLAGYDAVFLDNLPASRIAPEDQDALVSYVRSGGSLAMVGGDSSFGLGGWQSSPIAAAMPVIMKPPEHKERTRAFILIIDKSGSMGRNDKLKYAKAAAETVTKTLKGSDLVSVIGFDSQPFVVIPLEPLSKSRPYMDQMIDRLVAHGTTYLLPALQEAERMLAGSGAQIQHVVILTDGETGGTPAMYYDLVSRMHREGDATISTIAIGNDANLALLQSISKFGDGASYQTDSPKNLPELFVQDVRTHGGETTMQESSFKPHTVNPDPVLKELAGRQLPSIKGYVSTEIKPKADLSAYIERAGTREPLIASWKFGAGKTLAVTTDASGRWSGPWITSNVFTPVWDRLLGWMTPETSTAAQKFDVELGYQGGRIIIRLNDYSDESAKGPSLLTTVVTRPDATHVETALSEQVPGEFSGSIDAPAPGTYNISVRAPGDKTRTFPPLAYTVSPAVLAEVPRPAPNYGLLERLASATGGRLNPEVSEVGLGRPNLERRESLNPFIIVAAMILLIAEALVRRLTA
ncbi:MAG TPA: VWA domain-containing protein [Candidatus Binataceae bacterium]|nr:VWA domain-containing protein [Candidatus Binataceae bacterium]